MNNLVQHARPLPLNPAVQTVAISPITLPAKERGLPLEMRITAPVAGHDLPIILFSHGAGPALYISSKDGYAPLAHFYAEHGFVVIQPTHASSRVAGLDADLPGGPMFWRSRVEDMKQIIDQLDQIEQLTPAIAGRLDHDRIAIVGHSMGGQTAGMLLGARLTDPNDPNAVDVDRHDQRIKAGVLLAAPGNGGDQLSEYARKHFSFLNPDYTHLSTPTLSVVGDADDNPFISSRGPDWYTAAFRDAPGVDALLTIHGAAHSLGGIPGYDAKESTDENPDRLAVTQHLTWAYLRSALYPSDPAWTNACRILREQVAEVAHVDLA